MISLNLVTTLTALADFVSRAAIDALEGDFGLEMIATTFTTRAAAPSSDADRRLSGRSSCAVPQGGIYAIARHHGRPRPECEAFAWRLLEKETSPSCRAPVSARPQRGHIRCQPVPDGRASGGCGTPNRRDGNRPNRRLTDLSRSSRNDTEQRLAAAQYRAGAVSGVMLSGRVV